MWTKDLLQYYETKIHLFWEKISRKSFSRKVRSKMLNGLPKIFLKIWDGTVNDEQSVYVIENWLIVFGVSVDAGKWLYLQDIFICTTRNNAGHPEFWRNRPRTKILILDLLKQPKRKKKSITHRMHWVFPSLINI